MSRPPCGRCGATIRGEPEACFWCLGDLCATCWEAYGHCGEVEAQAHQQAARTWQPGDPPLSAPWEDAP